MPSRSMGVISPPLRDSSASAGRSLSAAELRGGSRSVSEPGDRMRLDRTSGGSAGPWHPRRTPSVDAAKAQLQSPVPCGGAPVHVEQGPNAELRMAARERECQRRMKEAERMMAEASRVVRNHIETMPRDQERRRAELAEKEREISSATEELRLRVQRVRTLELDLAQRGRLQIGAHEERENKVAAREQDVARREVALRESEARLDTRTAAVSARERQLLERAAELDAESDALLSRQLQPQRELLLQQQRECEAAAERNRRKEAQLAASAQELLDKQQWLDERERGIQAARGSESALDGRRRELEQLAQQLAEREAQQKRREVSLDREYDAVTRATRHVQERRAHVAEQESALAAREESVNQREACLREAELRAEERERQLDGQQAAADRETELCVARLQQELQQSRDAEGRMAQRASELEARTMDAEGRCAEAKAAAKAEKEAAKADREALRRARAQVPELQRQLQELVSERDTRWADKEKEAQRMQWQMREISERQRLRHAELERREESLNEALECMRKARMQARQLAALVPQAPAAEPAAGPAVHGELLQLRDALARTRADLGAYKRQLALNEQRKQRWQDIVVQALLDAGLSDKARELRQQLEENYPEFDKLSTSELELVGPDPAAEDPAAGRGQRSSVRTSPEPQPEDGRVPSAAPSASATATGSSHAPAGAFQGGRESGLPQGLPLSVAYLTGASDSESEEDPAVLRELQKLHAQGEAYRRSLSKGQLGRSPPSSPEQAPAFRPHSATPPFAAEHDTATERAAAPSGAAQRGGSASTVPSHRVGSASTQTVPTATGAAAAAAAHPAPSSYAAPPPTGQEHRS